MDSELLADMLDTIRERSYNIDSVSVIRNGYMVVDAYVHLLEQRAVGWQTDRTVSLGGSFHAQAHLCDFAGWVWVSMVGCGSWRLHGVGLCGAVHLCLT